MRRTILALALLAFATAGCGRQGDDGTVSLPSLPLWGPEDESATPDPGEAERRIARSIWALVPAAPSEEPEPGRIRGSAVAVAADTLLATCGSMGQREEVGLLRRSAHRVAPRVATDHERRICALRLPGEELRPPHAYRSFADLRVGEPVLAVASRTSRSFTVERGWLVGKGGAADPYLETTLVLPPGTLSAALFDAFGNLIGFGAAGPASDSTLLAAPVPPGLASRLRRVELAASPALLASLAPAPRGQPRPQPVVLPFPEAD
jgi:hypothetical protein